MKISAGTQTRRIAAIATASALLLGLAACAAPEAAEEEGTAAPFDATFQLGWLPNVESAPMLVAESNGYYADEAINITFAPGGPQVVTDAQIVSGNALIGTLSSEGLANAVAAGAPLVAIGAIYQTSSSAIISLAGSGITEPKDLEGKRFGFGQSDARVYEPFFTMVGVDINKIELVSGATDPASLLSGEVDAISGTLANQPIALASQGAEVNEIRLADFGYNRWSGVLVVRKDSLTDPEKRDAIIRILKATRNGLQSVVDDPTAAAQTVFDEYGEQLGLVLDNQIAGAKVWASLATDSASGSTLLRITDKGVATQQAFFDSIGLTVTAKDFFDTSVGDEAFAD